MADEQRLAESQRQHWQDTYTAHPGIYGEEPSAPAVRAAEVFRAAGARQVLELGAGHGRDALYFAAKGFTVQAADFSATGLEQLHRAALAEGLGSRVATVVHDVRKPLTLADASVGFVHENGESFVDERGRHPKGGQVDVHEFGRHPPLTRWSPRPRGKRPVLQSRPPQRLRP
ncbi:methyltransferase domain-containing protein [Streptomyces sp. NPDC007863]|uniref:methyltransferase domain-containing protein n=1 Tax=Streptomyces sp. NPDC007863 TaxID=3154894 RepID=UPI0033C5BBEE